MLKAYNDTQGYVRKFYLNAVTVAERELDMEEGEFGNWEYEGKYRDQCMFFLILDFVSLHIYRVLPLTRSFRPAFSQAAGMRTLGPMWLNQLRSPRSPLRARLQQSPSRRVSSFTSCNLTR